MYMTICLVADYSLSSELHKSVLFRTLCPAPIEHTPLSRKCNSCIKKQYAVVGAVSSKMTTFPLSGSLAKWLSSSFHWRNGMAFGPDHDFLGWWHEAEVDGVSLDTRPQRSCLFPPTFNTSAFTMSIKPDEPTSPKRRKGDLSTDQQNCTKTRTIPATRTSWPSNQPGDAQQAQLGSCDRHTPELQILLYTAAISRAWISYTVRGDYCKFISPCCRRRNWGSARLSDL